MAGQEVNDAYLRFGASRGQRPHTMAAARLILEIIDEFYGPLCEYCFSAEQNMQRRLPRGEVAALPMYAGLKRLAAADER